MALRLPEPTVSDFPFGDKTDLAPGDYLACLGTVFATFDSRTQDSGNVSFGVSAGGRRWFVKTAGNPADATPFLKHAERVALLDNARQLSATPVHPFLPRLHGVIGSLWGPMLVYDWVEGELLRVPASERLDPKSAFQRFRALPRKELEAALDAVIAVHVELCARGWVASDFYDGALIYDFGERTIHLVDLDHYRRGPFTNEMGRMFGSTRFMAPEEFKRGALIDERTTVFTLGRMLSVFLGDGTLAHDAFGGTEPQYRAMMVACSADREARFRTVAELARAWRASA